MRKLKNLIVESNNINKDSYVWNMVGSILIAFQSVIMLMILTRIAGIAEAGIFTIAYANANLFLTIGKYGMRNFQVSDVKKQFSFSEYHASRKITSGAMIITSILYVIYSTYINSYTLEKSLIIVIMCFFKVIDAVEDIYLGLYQQRGRLDIASKILTLRIGLTIIVFGGGIIILENQLAALIISTVFSGGLLFVFIKWTYPVSEINKSTIQRKNLLKLMKSCFPLFAGSFLSFYIGNAPKYAIDTTLSDELQACYGFISMPVFVIGLLNGFIFNPMLFQLSKMWADRNLKLFVRKIGIQFFIIVGITIVCIIGTYLIGIPVLSFMYSTNLKPYKTELIILLVGGGFLGLTGLLNTVITIMRFQKQLIFGYMFVAVLAFCFSDFFVKKYALMGAALLYVTLMSLLSVCFLIIFFVGIAQKA